MIFINPALISVSFINMRTRGHKVSYYGVYVIWWQRQWT